MVELDSATEAQLLSSELPRIAREEESDSPRSSSHRLLGVRSPRKSGAVCPRVRSHSLRERGAVSPADGTGALPLPSLAMAPLWHFATIATRPPKNN